MVLLTGVLFFASGAAALFYQIAWQRTLFGWYGVDLDSVSVIVSIFMLGLGVGAIVGGWLADHFQFKRILVFSRSISRSAALPSSLSGDCYERETLV
jgi:MFS family permease